MLRVSMNEVKPIIKKMNSASTKNAVHNTAKKTFDPKLCKVSVIGPVIAAAGADIFSAAPTVTKKSDCQLCSDYCMEILY